MYGPKRKWEADEHRDEDDQHLTDVGGDQEVDELTNVGIDNSAFFDCGHDACEVVVRQHHVSRFLGHIGARDPHGHADVRSFEGRRVVDAVPGHGSDVVPLHERIDDFDFVLGRHAGVDVNLLDLGQEFAFVQFVEVGAGDGPPLRPKELKILGDGDWPS